MKLILTLLIIVFILLIIFIRYSLSLPEAFKTQRTCSITFGFDCGSDYDDVLLTPDEQTCNGTRSTTFCDIKEIHINQTSFFPNSGINVTCDSWQQGNYNATYYIWYHDGSGWYKINETNYTIGIAGTYRNISVVFTLNSTLGKHIVRCIGTCINQPSVPNVPVECANSTYIQRFDNDDVNFTVTDYPKYNFWNLTNYTTGEIIQDYKSFTRNDTINASANWDKDLSHALITHNGTGSFQNYTISITGNYI